MKIRLSASYLVLQAESISDGVQIGILEEQLRNRRYRDDNITAPLGVMELPIDIKTPYEIEKEIVARHKVHKEVFGTQPYVPAAEMTRKRRIIPFMKKRIRRKKGYARTI